MRFCSQCGAPVELRQPEGDTFERHVLANLHLVRIGRRLLVPTAELERWVEGEMAIPLLAELSRSPRSK